MGKKGTETVGAVSVGYQSWEGNNAEEDLSLGFDGDYDLKPEVLVEGEELITLLFVNT